MKCIFKKKGDNKMKDAKYYNKKWKQSPIIYGGRALRGRKDRINVDVKEFISTIGLQV